VSQLKPKVEQMAQQHVWYKFIQIRRYYI